MIVGLISGERKCIERRCSPRFLWYLGVQSVTYLKKTLIFLCDLEIFPSQRINENTRRPDSRLDGRLKSHQIARRAISEQVGSQRDTQTKWENCGVSEHSVCWHCNCLLWMSFEALQILKCFENFVYPANPYDFRRRSRDILMPMRWDAS